MSKRSIGQRIAKIGPTGTTYAYLNDHLGSARRMVGNGWSENYYPYGEIAAQTGSDQDTRFDFTGHERDRGTGLIYARARCLDCETGRWISVDPAAALSPDRSPYNYARNNPLGFLDPDGLKEFTNDECDQGAQLGEGDWCTRDRIYNRPKWRTANRHNLSQPLGYLQYVGMEQREAFYRWLANDLYGLGFRTMWVAGAAWVNQIVLGSKTWNMVSTILSPDRPVLTADAVAALDDINEAILAHVWTRLNDLYQMKTPLEGQPARDWDNATINYEQVQNPGLLMIHRNMPGHAREDLQRGFLIARILGGNIGIVYRFGPAFEGSFGNEQDRAAYARSMIAILNANPDLRQRVLAGQ